MSQNAMIDIAIGLMLMYLVLSLVCTVINEFIATKLQLRSASLESGIKQLLDDPTVRGLFYNHGLISGTNKAIERSSQSLLSSLMNRVKTIAVPVNAPPAQNAPVVAVAPQQAPVQNPPPAPAAAPADQGGEHPSYLSAETFTLALLGTLNPANPVPGFDDVKQAITGLPPSNLKSALLANLAAADFNLAEFRKKVATWFDDSMDRLSGAYKRQLKWISLAIGIIVAVLVNADTFEVGKALWSDSALRGQMVEAATKVAQKKLDKKPAENPSDVAQAFEDANDALRPLPIGWPVDSWLGKLFPAATTTPPATPPAATPEQHSGWETFWRSLWWTVTKVIGLLVTGFALSLGAPFWFDLLGKFVNIRGAGTKPERADKKG